MTNMLNSKEQAANAQSTLAAQTMAITDVTPLISHTVAEICVYFTHSLELIPRNAPALSLSIHPDMFTVMESAHDPAPSPLFSMRSSCPKLIDLLPNLRSGDFYALLNKNKCLIFHVNLTYPRFFLDWEFQTVSHMFSCWFIGVSVCHEIASICVYRVFWINLFFLFFYSSLHFVLLT